MNSNVPHLRSLVSVSCIETIVQVKILALLSLRSDKHMMAPLSALCQRNDYKLVHLNSRSYNGKIVQLQSALNDVTDFRAHNWKIFPNLLLVSCLLITSFIFIFLIVP